MKSINKYLLSFWFATKIINLTSLELALYFTYYHHHYSKIFLYLFFFSSSSDTHHLHGCHAVGINSLYVSFLSEFQLKSLMLVFLCILKLFLLYSDKLHFLSSRRFLFNLQLYRHFFSFSTSWRFWYLSCAFF